MKTMAKPAFLQSIGMDTQPVRPKDEERAPQFFKFLIGNGQVAIVESVAKNAMLEIVRHPIEIQEKIIEGLARLVKEPGDQAVLEDDAKNRSVRVVRLASEHENVHKLLLTF